MLTKIVTLELLFFRGNRHWSRHGLEDHFSSGAFTLWLYLCVFVFELVLDFLLSGLWWELSIFLVFHHLPSIKVRHTICILSKKKCYIRSSTKAKQS